MRLTAKTAIAAAIVTNAAQVSGATSSYCPASRVCFQWGVPEAAASSGSGNVYFQLKAPTTFEWVGLGIGTQMRGADMFVMYASGNDNVTLSTRRGAGHVMPQFVQRSDVELLAGSGISDGQMTANVRCGACTELNLAGSTGWLAAWLEGSPLNSESTSATISFHEAFNLFSVDLKKATISSDANPFLTAQGNNTGGGGNGNGSGSGNGVTDNGSDVSQTLAYAHGILMTLVFVVGYPIGSIMMPLIGNWIIHASWQMLIFFGMWAGFGIGYVIANRAGWFFTNSHTQLGVFVVALMGLQPVFGWLHHRYYLKHRGRGIISYVHIWYGRALIIIGIVNGGLGLQLAGTPRHFCIAYIVVAAVFALIYVSAFVFGLFRSRRSRVGDASAGMRGRSGAKEREVSA